MRPTADRRVRKGAARSALVRFVCALAACAAGCARGGLQARPDVTPQLARLAVQAASAEAAARDPAAGPPLTPQEQIDHVLSRVTFGARPGDRERVEKLGVSTFLEEQLHPERIDDPAVAKQLEGGYAEVARTVHPHPTFSEAVMEAARAADGWVIHA